jgi:glycosyltransferase involved in cell wall biosynthesis
MSKTPMSKTPMKLSVYTFVKDGLYYDFHVVAMLRHHVPLADEIIVNEGHSQDGTYEAIRDLDPKIKVHRSRWDRTEPKTWSMKFKNQARRLCSGDWCILLDIDEFIPEWEFERIRQTLASTDLTILPLKYVHFYGNYKVINAHPERFGWPVVKHPVHRNLPSIEVWGDGSNVGPWGRLDTSDSSVGGEPLAEVHHFGFVRKAARLRHKWRNQRKRNDRNRWDWVPSFVYDLMPHDWADPDLLPSMAIYEGPFISAVRDNPDEFVRDDFRLLDMLSRRCGPRAEAGA